MTAGEEKSPAKPGSAVFWSLFGIDAIAAAVAVYFFLVGLADGTVSSFNAGTWFVLLAGIVAVMAGGLVLRSAGRPHLGSVVLLILAVPTLVAGFLILLLIVAPPRWN